MGESRVLRIGILLLTVVALVVGFAISQGAGDEEDPAAVSSAPTAPATTGSRQDVVPTISLDSGDEPRTITVSSGERVRLRFTAAGPGVVHIHGYDIERDVPADGGRTITFTADAEGVFEIENHGTGAVVARLEVRP